MERDIAVIGIAGKFPEAEGLEAFRQNLVEGRDSVRNIGLQRLVTTTVPTEADYQILGYLEDIDKFDHKFFNLSRAEAENMDPHQRILMEQSYAAFDSAGYSPDDFAGSRTAVIFGDVNLYLYSMFSTNDSGLTGSLNSGTAGRISRYFDLRGTAFMIDTACSSGLAAVHMGCQEILTGNADHALVGSIDLKLLPNVKGTGEDLGIASTDGKTRSFSAQASGSGSGEVAAVVLLKRMDKAIEDNDYIYGVVKASGTNQDAALSGSLTAPSSSAQAELIKEVWDKANVDPLTIDYIEAHGSGTKLGDPTEIGGLEQAFEGHEAPKHSVAVSSVKSNIGHCGNAAGVVGFVKALLAVYKKEHYPSLHFDEPNPFIDFDNSPFFVNTEYKAWEKSNGTPRRAGVSSFGLSGTNVHAVLEEAPERQDNQRHSGPFLFPVSARSVEALQANRGAIMRWTRTHHQELADISYTLLAGRRHHNYRSMVVANSLDDLATHLMDEVKPKNIRKPIEKLILTFSDDTQVAPEWLESFAAYSTEFAAALEECKQAAPGQESNPDFVRFAFQYSCYKMLQAHGINSKDMLGLEKGKRVTQVLVGKAELKEALEGALNEPTKEIANFDARVAKLVEKETARRKVIFVEVGPAARLSNGLRNFTDKDYEGTFEVLSLDNSGKEGILQLFSELYNIGYALDFSNLGAATTGGQRVPLPVYQFDKIRCWVREPEEMPEDIDINAPMQQIQDVMATRAANPMKREEIVAPLDLSKVQADDTWTDTEKKVAAIWMDVLKNNNIKKNDDFFELGGHSLYSIKVINRVHREFKVRLDFNDVFVFSKIPNLAQAIDEKIEAGDTDATAWDLNPIPEAEHYAVSHAQERLWVLDQFDEEKIVYTLPITMAIQGDIHPEQFEKALEQLFRRHEALRTTFKEVDGKPRQVVHKFEDFAELTKPDVVDLRDEPDPWEAAKQFLNRELMTFFDLENGPLVRFHLLQTEDHSWVWGYHIHHIIADGWSLDVIMNDLMMFYDSAVRKLKPVAKDLRIHYKDFAAWQNNLLESEAIEPHRQYWMDRFKDGVPDMPLPLDFERKPFRTSRGGVVQIQTDVDLTADIRKLMNEHNVTLFMMFNTLTNVLMYRYTGVSDMVLGTITAGRENQGLEDQIGFYVSTLAMRSSFKGDYTFKDLMLQNKQDTLDAFAHQMYPFDVLVDEVPYTRQVNRMPMFDVSVMWRNTDNILADERQEAVEGAVAQAGFASDYAITKYDLAVRFDDEMGNSFGVRFEYNLDLFKHETIELMKDRFLKIAEAVAANPDIKLDEIPLSIEGTASGTDSQQAIDESFSNSF